MVNSSSFTDFNDSIVFLSITIDLLIVFALNHELKLSRISHHLIVLKPF